MTRTSDRYSIASIVLHWLMLALIVSVYAAIEFREFFPKGSAPRDALKTWHFMLGLSVLGLVWVRIAARLVWKPPAAADDGPAWQQRAAHIAHLALYAFMIGMYIMLAWGLFQIYVLGTPLRAESAGFDVHSEHGDVLGFAMVFLVARAFSSGCGSC